MEKVTIYPIPNQNLEFVSTDNNVYSIHLYTFNDLTFADIEVNGQYAAYGVLCVPDQNVIPSEYITQGTAGNFRFECKDEIYPNYRFFANSHSLFYYSKEELERQ